CDLLVQAGVEAFVSQDLSAVGGWALGLLPEIHKPQVWVDQANLESARPVLQAYERRKIERQRAVNTSNSTEGPMLEAACAECHKTSRFPELLRGTVQNCPHCGGFMDVESGSGDNEFAGFEETEEGDEEA